jgi:uncharacterized protein
MKPLLRLVIALLAAFLLVAAVPAAEPVYPNYSGFVNDYAGVLDDATKTKIEALCRELEAKTSAEMALAVVKSVAPLDTKTYAVKLFEQWKIGKKGKDNGLLILLAMDERRVEIEVGYGLEGTLNDAKVGALLDQYGVPFFKAGQYGDGLYNVAAALSYEIAAAAGQELGDGYKPAAPAAKDNWRGNDSVLSLAVILIAVFSALFSGPLAGMVGALIGGLFGYFLWGAGGLAIGGLVGFVVSYLKFFGGGWGGGMFGGGFGGGDDGGFGGFGGGGSGGGGAGRSW